MFKGNLPFTAWFSLEPKLWVKMLSNWYAIGSISLLSCSTPAFVRSVTALMKSGLLSPASFAPLLYAAATVSLSFSGALFMRYSANSQPWCGVLIVVSEAT